MNKGAFLLIAGFLMSSFAWGQQVQSTDSLSLDDSDFTFTETQLDEDADIAQSISSISTAKDPYLSDVGYAFSAMRFRVRGMDNQYNNTYLNGVMMNDMEGGRFSYSLIGGMNDATRNKEGVSAADYNLFGVTNVGGGNNINLRAGQFSQGNKITVSGANRNYTMRGMYTYGSGFNAKGWAFAASVGYRWADYKTAYVEGTFYNSLSYFFAAEKRFNLQHSLNLSTFGAPTQRAQNGAATEEAYWLANSHYYNPNWGYQEGKIRNARVVHDFQPTAILTWDWKRNQNQKLTTSAAFKYAMYSNSSLTWGDRASDPRPDYYKNFPSSIFNVYDKTKNNSEYLYGENNYLLTQWEQLYDYWQTKSNRQIQWDRLIAANQQNNQVGDGEALYYQERRHNDQMTVALNSAWSHLFNAHHKYSAGLELNATKGMHYKTMDDLLGANTYIDHDKFATTDYGRYSREAQNDLRHPNRVIGVGDKFGYNYNILVNRAKLWGQYQFTMEQVAVNVAAHTEGTTMERDGLMQNGRYEFNSYGKSGAAKFLGGGAKVQAVWTPNSNHRINAAIGWDSQAPLARYAFVAAQEQNNFVNNLSLEDIFSAELGYTFTLGPVSGKIGGYYTKFMNGLEQTAFYNDDRERFTYLSMTGVDRVHYGVEFALNWQAMSNLNFFVLGTISEAKYTSNPYAELNYSGMDQQTLEDLNNFTNPVTNAKESLRVIADGMRVGSTPLTAISVGGKYNINGWYLEAALKYYDRVYIGYSQYRRLNSILANSTTHNQIYVFGGSYDADGNPVWDVAPGKNGGNPGIWYNENGKVVATSSGTQEKCKRGFMLDASIGKYLRLHRGRSLNFNLQLQNITNNTNLKTGGYEQNRDDSYSTGVARVYQYSKNPKYYYAYGFQFFMNVGFKF